MTTYKVYYWHTGYVGNLKERILQDQMARDPTEVIRKAVIGMLPKNKLHQDVRFYFGPRKEAENISSQQAFIRRQASADFEMPPREVREMIRAQKQLQSSNDSKKGEKRESKEGDTA